MPDPDRKRRLPHRFWRDRRGQATILFALAMTVVVGSASVVVDVGNLYLAHFRLQEAADAAALAGAAALPLDPAGARALADQYAAENGIRLDPQRDVTISSGNTRITVRPHRVVANHFARLFGIDTTELGAVATATTGVITSYTGGDEPRGSDLQGPDGDGDGSPDVYHFGGLLPWCVLMDSVPTSDELAAAEASGMPITRTLKMSSSNLEGNFYACDLGDTGGDTYRQNVATGSHGRYGVGQTLWSETGNMVGPTQQGFGDLLTDAQIQGLAWVLVPVITVDGAFNGKTEMTLQGFAVFLLTADSYQGGAVTGTFVAAIVNGGTSDTVTTVGAFGAYSDPALAAAMTDSR